MFGPAANLFEMNAAHLSICVPPHTVNTIIYYKISGIRFGCVYPIWIQLKTGNVFFYLFVARRLSIRIYAYGWANRGRIPGIYNVYVMKIASHLPCEYWSNVICNFICYKECLCRESVRSGIRFDDSNSYHCLISISYYNSILYVSTNQMEIFRSYPDSIIIV